MSDITKRLGERELDILQVLWDLGEATVAEVHAALIERGHEVAYTTVHTMMTRLESKSVVRRDESERAHRYRAVLKQPSAADGAVRWLADRFFRGSVARLATHLVEKD